MGEWFETRNFSVARSDQKWPLWQPGFFDHLLRNDESYSQKWKYVRENPVRSGLVSRADEWPYQGEFMFIIAHESLAADGRLYTGMVIRNKLVSGASGFS